MIDRFKELLRNYEVAQAARALCRERFGEVGIFENDLYPGIRDALATLAASGRRLFVATSKPTIYAERIIDNFGPARYFEAVCGSELDGTRSDKTELLVWLLRERQVDPGAATMVGGRSHDMIGARNNGMVAIGVLYGYGNKSELVTAGAVKLCSSPDDLTVLLR